MSEFEKLLEWSDRAGHVIDVRVFPNSKRRNKFFMESFDLLGESWTAVGSSLDECARDIMIQLAPISTGLEEYKGFEPYKRREQ